MSGLAHVTSRSSCVIIWQYDAIWLCHAMFLLSDSNPISSMSSTHSRVEPWMGPINISQLLLGAFEMELIWYVDEATGWWSNKVRPLWCDAIGHFDIFVPDLVSTNRKVQIHPVAVHVTIFPPWCDSFRRGSKYVKVNKPICFDMLWISRAPVFSTVRPPVVSHLEVYSNKRWQTMIRGWSIEIRFVKVSGWWAH